MEEQNKKKYTMIRISVELQKHILTIGSMGDSYEDVIWKLINHKIENKEEEV